MEHVILNEYSELSVGVYVFCLKLFYFMMLKAEKLHNKQKNINVISDIFQSDAVVLLNTIFTSYSLFFSGGDR